MKHKLISLILTFMLALGLILPYHAQGTSEPYDLNYFEDIAMLLSPDDLEELNDRAEQLSHEYNCGVYFLSIDDYTDITEDSSVSIREFAEMVYLAYDLGETNEKSGMLLVLSMAERDWALIAYGGGNSVLTDYGRDVMSDHFLSEFGDNDWEDGLESYLDDAELYLEMAHEGTPFDVDNDPRDTMIDYVILAVIFVVVFCLALLLLRAQMKPVKLANQARDYVPGNGVTITHRSDRFLHTRTHRTKIEKSSSRKGGTSVNSRGFSGSSGKF